MPRNPGKRQVEIPDTLWDALDRAAEIDSVPLAQLVSDWLWETMGQRFKDSRLYPQYAELTMPPKPYDRWRLYPRRPRPARAAPPAGEA